LPGSCKRIVRDEEKACDFVHDNFFYSELNNILVSNHISNFKTIASSNLNSFLHSFEYQSFTAALKKLIQFKQSNKFVHSPILRHDYTPSINKQIKTNTLNAISDLCYTALHHLIQPLKTDLNLLSISKFLIHNVINKHQTPTLLTTFQQTKLISLYPFTRINFPPITHSFRYHTLQTLRPSS